MSFCDSVFDPFYFTWIIEKPVGASKFLKPSSNTFSSNETLILLFSPPRCSFDDFSRLLFVLTSPL